MHRHPDRQFTSPRLSRRGALQTLGLGALAGAIPSTSLLAQTAAPAAATTTRLVPRSREALPAIGLGTFLTFDVIPGQKRDHLREVLRRFWDAGGRVVDTSPLYGTGEISVGDFATALGIDDQMFIANKIWSTGEYLADESHARRSLEQSQGRLWRDRIDLMQCHSLVNAELIVPYLLAWKKEGRIRYAGITHYEVPYLPILTGWVERHSLDFVQVNYSIATRQAEERLLPVAAGRGTAVLVNMPLEKARLLKIVEGRPLPDFAKDIAVDSWAQFFLKWVIAHPAVTCALPATSNPDHVVENMGALRGPLPDAAMRARMVRHMETIPGFDRIAQMPWYPDKRYSGIIGRSQSDLRARS
jgi:diketogulonate reductase-like aldo/keto reductase